MCLFQNVMLTALLILLPRYRYLLSLFQVRSLVITICCLCFKFTHSLSLPVSWSLSSETIAAVNLFHHDPFSIICRLPLRSSFHIFHFPSPCQRCFPPVISFEFPTILIPRQRCQYYWVGSCLLGFILSCLITYLLVCPYHTWNAVMCSFFSSAQVDKCCQGMDKPDLMIWIYLNILEQPDQPSTFKRV